MTLDILRDTLCTHKCQPHQNLDQIPRIHSIAGFSWFLFAAYDMHYGIHIRSSLMPVTSDSVDQILLWPWDTNKNNLGKYLFRDAFQIQFQLKFSITLRFTRLLTVFMCSKLEPLIQRDKSQRGGLLADRQLPASKSPLGSFTASWQSTAGSSRRYQTIIDIFKFLAGD